MIISALNISKINFWRLAIISAIVIVFYLLLATSAFAQINTAQETIVGNPTTQVSPIGSNFEEGVPVNQKTFIQSSIIEFMAAASCILAGYDPTTPDGKCLGTNPINGKIGFKDNQGGLLGVSANLITMTYTPPISSTQYVDYLARNFGLTEKAYAQSNSVCVGNSPQGVGFCGIQPLLPMWVAMRNLAYLLFTIIFVFIGLAIMLRVKIDPRTVMTIQNQIPRIIVGILMVTFSFAIAGLLIDVMYVSIYVVGQAILNIKNVNVQDFGVVATSGTPFDAINRLFAGGFGELSTRGGGVIDGLTRNVMGIEPGTGNFLADLGTDFVGTLVASFVGFIAAVIIFFALLYIAIRVFIVLLLSYINILLDIIFAPFWFLIGLLPGSSLGVGAWFRDIVSNLAVYPTTLAMFLLGRIFFDLGQQIGTNGALFTPPMVGVTGGEGAAPIFAGLVALGFLFMTPNVVTIVKSAIKAPKISYGPVFHPAGVAAGALSQIPKRSFTIGERYRYGGGNVGIFEGLYRRLGNPIYDPNRHGPPPKKS